MWSDSGIRVLASSLVGRLWYVWLLSLDYCMYFYTEITYVLYATSAVLNYFLRFPIFLSHEAAICLSVHLYIKILSLEAVYVCSCLCACTCV